MASSTKPFTCNNLLALKTRSDPIMCVSYIKLSMASNKPHAPALNVSATSFSMWALFVVKLIHQCLFFVARWLVLLLYVDDIILTGENPQLLSSFISTLGKEFDMTDLGDLHYFLGIAASRSSSGLFLSQTKYALEESCHALLQAHEHPVIYWHEAFTGLWYAVFRPLFLSKPCWRIAVSHSHTAWSFLCREFFFSIYA